MADVAPQDDLRAALRSAGVDVWAWDLDTDRMSEGDLGLSQIGYAPGERAWTQADWAERIHPEDRPAYDMAFDRYRRGETTIWECVYRILGKDGRWRHVEGGGRFGQGGRCALAIADVIENAAH